MTSSSITLRSWKFVFSFLLLSVPDNLRSADLEGYWKPTDETIETIISKTQELTVLMDVSEDLKARAFDLFLDKINNQVWEFRITEGTEILIRTINPNYKKFGLGVSNELHLSYTDQPKGNFQLKQDQQVVISGKIEAGIMTFPSGNKDIHLELRRLSPQEENDLINKLMNSGLWDPETEDVLEQFPESEFDASEIFEIAALDKNPKIKKKNLPIYPPHLKQKRIQGNVVLSFFVDEEGKTRKIEVLESTDERFNQAAIDSIKDTLFSPGEKDGIPVKTKVKLPISFTLKR